jgi:hypothetical protein
LIPGSNVQVDRISGSYRVIVRVPSANGVSADMMGMKRFLDGREQTGGMTRLARRASNDPISK